MTNKLFKPQYLLVAAAAAIICLYTAGFARTFPNGIRQRGSRLPMDSAVQQSKDASARSHAAEDELTQGCVDCRNTTLSGGQHLLGVTQLRTGPDGSIYVLDAHGHSLQQFDKQGNYLRIVGTGKTGSGAGEFLFASDIDVHPSFGLSVSDFKQTRISRLSPNGDFQGSFSIAQERFLARSVFRPRRGTDTYVCGNRYGPTTTALHRYSASGEFLASLMPLPQWALQLNADAFDDCLSSTSESHTLVAFPYDYQVSELAGDEITVVKLDAPADFRRPSRPLVFSGTDGQEHMDTFQAWKLEWTPIENIALMTKDVLLVQYKTYNPLRYTLDARNFTTGERLRVIHTNYRLLTVDGSGRPYFLADHSKGETPYEVFSRTFSW